MSLDVARESAGVVLARFQEGRVSARELEQAHSEEAANWLAFLDADFALERARLDLLRQTGGLRAALHP
jgi:outer membrane protein TolC